MVTENPRDGTGSSPHKPKKVWKPKPAGEGVPSLFAHAVLSKPLKINNAATSTVKVKSKETTTAINSNKKENQETQKPTHSASQSTSATVPAPPSKSKFSTIKDTTVKPVESVNANTNTTTITNTSSKKGIGQPSKGRASTTTKSESDGVKRATPKSDERHRKPNQPALVFGGCSTVAGTPQSWPKPHAASETEKPKNRRSSGKGNKDDEQFHKEIDHLIPEMYRKKSAKQLEQEQKEEIQLMRQIMFELQQQELARQEEALRYKPISIDVDTTLNVLKNAKKMNDKFDDHASVDDSDTSSKRKSAFSTHIKSKLAFFNSHHSVSHDSSESDDSSVSSWNSDESDGLFRG